MRVIRMVVPSVVMVRVIVPGVVVRVRVGHWKYRLHQELRCRPTPPRRADPRRPGECGAARAVGARMVAHPARIASPLPYAHHSIRVRKDPNTLSLPSLPANPPTPDTLFSIA